MMLLYMKTSWSIEIRSSTLNSTMSPDVYQSSGGRGKLDFMRNPCALNDLYMPDNPKMEELLVGVFQTVCKRLEEVPRTSSLVVPSVGTEEKDDLDNDSDDSDDDSDDSDDDSDNSDDDSDDSDDDSDDSDDDSDDSDDDSDSEDSEDKDKSTAKSATKGVDEGADESVFASVIKNGTMTKSATGSTTQSTQSGDEANRENQHNILLAVISRGLKGEWVTSDAAVSQHVLMPNDVASSAQSSSKRSRDMAERNGIFVMPPIAKRSC